MHWVKGIDTGVTGAILCSYTKLNENYKWKRLGTLLSY
jgi:hypothetical protein